MVVREMVQMEIFERFAEEMTVIGPATQHLSVGSTALATD